MKVTVNITIDADGQVTADVVGGTGQICITKVLVGLEQLLGEADVTKVKPEYHWDEEAVQMLRQQGVTT